MIKLADLSDKVHDLEVKLATLHTQMTMVIGLLEELSRNQKEIKQRLNECFTDARFDHFYEGEHLVWRREVDDRLTAARNFNSYALIGIGMLFTMVTIAIQIWNHFS